MEFSKTFWEKPWFDKGKVPTVNWGTAKSPDLAPYFNSPPKGESETQYVQPYWNGAMERLENEQKSLLQTILTDEHHHATIGTRKPDILGWKKLKGDQISKSTFYLTIIGELKLVRAKAAFVAEEKGKLIIFIITLLEEQFFRSEVTGII